MAPSWLQLPHLLLLQLLALLQHLPLLHLRLLLPQSWQAR